MKYLLSIILLVVGVTLHAQNISVADFRLDEMDLTANQHGTTVLDQNGEKCALIKVETTQTGFTFDVGSLGVQKTVQKAGEIWVYVPAGVRKMTVSHPQIGVLRDYQLPVMTKKAKTYVMKLTAANVRTIIEQDAGGNFLALSVVPAYATVSIDGQIQPNDSKGEYSIFLSYGKHTYKIETASYATEEGVVEIGQDVISKKITLVSTKAAVSVVCPTQGAQLFLNKKPIGSDKWEGTLAAGTYLIEAKKAGHQTLLQNIVVKEKENKTVTLPALVPLYGKLKVNVKPIGSKIEIDGLGMGTTPAVLQNILVGTHSLKVTAPNGNSVNKTIEIKENEMSSVEDIISEYTAKDYLALAKKANEQEQYSKAAEWFTKAAEQGYADAQYNLGLCYKNGRGVQQDYSKAVEWFRKAAEQGNTYAQCNLGGCYYNGWGVQEDHSKAVEWYRKAAKQGYAEAQCRLGFYYYKGQGVQQDYSKAAEWYTKAAEQGYANAQCNLGFCYYNGQGVHKDYSKAVVWYTKAAEQGYAEAQYNLGLCYKNGQGVQQDYSKAVEWYTKAAEQGDADAQNKLGVFYERGWGVQKDYSKAIEWFRKAAEQGYADAKQRLKELGVK